MALFSMLNQAEDGESLTPSMYNNEFQNIIDNMGPDGVEDASATLTEMRATADPYPGAVASLATSLRGELQRLRYLIAQITGKTYWYEDPDTALTSVATLTGTQTLTNKTLTTPTIADFTNANHNHSNAAGGGTPAISLSAAGVTGTFTTASLASGAMEIKDITHGLGTENLLVLLTAKGDSLSASEDQDNWMITVKLSTLHNLLFLGPGNSGTSMATLISAPGSGVVRFGVVNTDAAAQTITVRYTIMKA